MSPYPMEQATMRPALLKAYSSGPIWNRQYDLLSVGRLEHIRCLSQPARLLKLHNSVDWAFVGVDDESSFPLLEDSGGAAS